MLALCLVLNPFEYIKDMNYHYMARVYDDKTLYDVLRKFVINGTDRHHILNMKDDWPNNFMLKEQINVSRLETDMQDIAQKINEKIYRSDTLTIDQLYHMMCQLTALAHLLHVYEFQISLLRFDRAIHLEKFRFTLLGLSDAMQRSVEADIVKLNLDFVKLKLELEATKIENLKLHKRVWNESPSDSLDKIDSPRTGIQRMLLQLQNANGNSDLHTLASTEQFLY
jgi:hypothetical protein